MGEIKRTKYSIHDKAIVIRNAEIEDSEKLIEHMKKVDAETTFLLREPDEFNMTLENEEKFISAQKQSEVNLILVAEVDGKIVGSCGLNGSSRKRLRHTANLGIAIKKDYWGMGIGRRLMEAGIQWAKNNGISRITLQADTVNYRALSLYLKLGFEIEGTLRNDKLMADGSYRNTYTMALLV